MGVLAGPGAGFFEGGGGLDYEWVLEAASGDLQAGGEAVAGEAAGDGGGGLAGEVEGKTAANPVILNAVKDLLALVPTVPVGMQTCGAYVPTGTVGTRESPTLLV